MPTRIHPGSPVAGALEAADVGALVFAASGPDLGEDWDAIALELGEAFDLTQVAMRDGTPVVYLVAGEDLLGQRGAPAAMVACGLLSAARTAAVEGARAGIPVNVVAAFGDAEVDEVVEWVRRLADPAGMSGELVRLGTGHLGKALP